jgi:haloalkane dehalogenase
MRPACGLSERSNIPVTLTDAAIAVGAVIDTLDLHDVTLVAYDLGGPAGIGAAAERTDRITKTGGRELLRVAPQWRGISRRAQLHGQSAGGGERRGDALATTRHRHRVRGRPALEPRGRCAEPILSQPSVDHTTSPHAERSMNPSAACCGRQWQTSMN